MERKALCGARLGLSKQGDQASAAGPGKQEGPAVEQALHGECSKHEEKAPVMLQAERGKAAEPEAPAQQ
jgi:hypothetical protein